MKKRRKRTNANVPAKGRLREMADRLWSLTIRDDWMNQCAICGKGPCDAHHIIPRANEATRYSLENGIALCAQHHQFCPELSPHQNAAGWMAWLEKYQPLRHAWLTTTIENGDHLRFSGTKNATYYCDVIMSFREYVDAETFEKVVGIAFSKYLLEQ